MSSDTPSRRELWAWCFYDFANSSFSTLIITVAYSVYFVQVVAGPLAASSPGAPERLWFWGYAASMLTAALLSPSLGAIADTRASKRPFLIGATLLCVTFTALLALVGPGDVVLGLVAFGVANVAFELGFAFCSAFLVELSTPATMGRLSGYGWGLGYAGGLLSLALAYPFLSGGFAEENLPLYRLAFLVTAVFFLIAALPTMLWLRERARPQSLGPDQSAWRVGFIRLAETARKFRHHRDLFAYFIAYLIYTDAINTVIVASAIFANKVLDFSPGDLIIYFLVTQVTAGLGAAGFGIVTDRIGAKRTIGLTLLLWVGLTLAASVVQTHAQFYVIGLLAGAALGANQSASRTLIGLFTPAGRSGEFFGFFGVMGKFAAIIGPIVYGEVTARTGSQRWAIVTMSVFFAIGGLALRTVNEPRGIAAARQTSEG